jgi:membrane protease YdiL (CAAX protease family)
MMQLVLFFTVTYIISWSAFFGAAALSQGEPVAFASAPVSGAVYLIGVFTPALVALAFAAWESGRAGIIALLRRIIQIPRNAWWFVFATVYIAAIKLLAALLHRLFAGAWPHMDDTRLLVLLLATIISTPVQSGEEIGWRGYALPRLASRIGLGRASIVLGVILSVWHLPFFFIPGTDKSGQSIPLYILQVTALSVAMAWLYWRTNQSLLIVMLMHAAVNNTKDIIPSAVSETTKAVALNASLVGWLTVALLWICAVYFLIRMRNQKLQIGEDPQLSTAE